VNAGFGVDDGGEDGIDVGIGVNVGGGETVLLLDWELKFVPVLGFVQVGVFILGFQVGVFKFVRSSWGVQVSAFCEFLVSILWWSKPPHHV
jgi:hypothetical protein